MFSPTLRTIPMGITAGLVAGGAAAQALRSVLLGIQPLDVATFAIVPLTVVCASALVCVPVIRRVTRLNASDLLRHE